MPSIDAAEFSSFLADSDVVFLPLTDNGRAAGHMVLVEALQRGKPVIASWVAGMDEYFDGDFVQSAGTNLVPQLRAIGQTSGARADEVRAYWEREYSKEAFGRRVLGALERMRKEGSP